MRGKYYEISTTKGAHFILTLVLHWNERKILRNIQNKRCAFYSNIGIETKILWNIHAKRWAFYSYTGIPGGSGWRECDWIWKDFPCLMEKSPAGNTINVIAKNLTHALPHLSQRSACNYWELTYPQRWRAVRAEHAQREKSVQVYGYKWYSIKELCPTILRATEGQFLALLMVRLLSSKAQECKILEKPLKPCRLGIHLKALAEYSHMSTHLHGFQ